MTALQPVAPAIHDPALSSGPEAAAPRPARKPRRRSRSTAVLGAAGMTGFLLLLEALPRLGVVNLRDLPPLSTMLGALADLAGTGTFWSALGSTVSGWAVGLSVALIAGVTAGLIIGTVPLLRSVTSSTIEFLRPIPSVALIPLAVILFGTDMRSTLLLVVYAAFWQVLIQVLYGVADVDPVARETARSFRFGRLTQIRTVTWPTTLPYVVTGFRLAAAVALILEITGELIIGSPGLGKQIALAGSAGAVPTMYALVLVTGLIGVVVNVGARATERRLLRWHPSIRVELR